MTVAGSSAGSWSSAHARLLRCARCGLAYGELHVCPSCLHAMNADPAEKRGILLPSSRDAGDLLSSIL